MNSALWSVYELVHEQWYLFMFMSSVHLSEHLWWSQCTSCYWETVSKSWLMTEPSIFIVLCILVVFWYIIYIISGHKWYTTHRVLTSHRSKMGVIYMQSWKQCALPVITTMALWELMHLGTWCTVAHCWYQWVATKSLWW